MTCRTPGLVDVADRLQASEDAHTGFEVERDLVARAQPVEERAGRQEGQVAIGRTGFAVVLRGAGEEQAVEGVAHVRTVQGLLLGSVQLGTGGRVLPSRKGLGAERLGPATRRVAQLAVQEPDDAVRDVVAVGVLGEVVRVGARGDEVQGQVADDLAGRCDLHEPPENGVGRRVQALDLLEAVAGPSATACCRRFDSWPPGISCW